MHPHLKQDLGPPEPPKMRSPGFPGQRKVSISEPTIDTYPAATQLSSDLLRLACAALSAEELAEWIASRKEESLLYRDPGTLDLDAKGRMVVAQSIPKERWAPSEKGPGVQTTFAGTKP